MIAVAGAGATITLLNRMGTPHIPWSDLSQWLDATSTEDALVAVVRLVALGVAWWVLASTTIYVIAAALRLPRLVRCLGWATLPGARRLVDGLVAGSIVAGTSLGTSVPALAEADDPVQSTIYTPRPAGDGPTYVPVPAGDDASTTTTATVPLPLPRPFVARRVPVTVHRVEPGEHLWGIAEDVVAGATGRPGTELGAADIAPYWRRLVDANTDRLRSGDPDLIHPGEELVVPELDEDR